MQITIEIAEEELKELIKNKLANEMLRDSSWQRANVGYGVRDGIGSAVKQYIYTEKENIIERVVERATKEVVKKTMQKMVDKI